MEISYLCRSCCRKRAITFIGIINGQGKSCSDCGSVASNKLHLHTPLIHSLSNRTVQTTPLEANHL